ncbi:MAG: hypothetical protein ACI3ZB_01090, partial [Prevotella sp.]
SYEQLLKFSVDSSACNASGSWKETTWIPEAGKKLHGYRKLEKETIIKTSRKALPYGTFSKLRL